MEAVQPGATLRQLHQMSVRLLCQGLRELGVVQARRERASLRFKECVAELQDTWGGKPCCVRVCGSWGWCRCAPGAGWLGNWASAQSAGCEVDCTLTGASGLARG